MKKTEKKSKPATKTGSAEKVKITFTTSKASIKKIDAYVKANKKYETRSDLLREMTEAKASKL